eukprot:gene10354-biopygen7215
MMNQNMACSGVSFATGGITPKASLVRKMMFLGWPATAFSRAPGMWFSGYATRVFLQMDSSLKSISPVRLSSMQFSATAPKRTAS